MAKCFMLRHQKAGIITSHVFLNAPTDAQRAPIEAECKRLHGSGWVIVHEAELLDESAPSFPERESAPASGSVAKAPEFAIRGEGMVINPGDVAEISVNDLGK